MPFPFRGALALPLLVAATSCAPAQIPPRPTDAATRPSTIAFVSTRDDPDANPLLAAEIYLMNGDGSDQRRLTRNTDGDAFPKLSPDGARILFDSNRRRREGDPLNVFDLFVMDADGNNQTFLTHGSSGSWAPDGRRVVFHASASGKGKPLK